MEKEIRNVNVVRVLREKTIEDRDVVAVEQPLEIRIGHPSIPGGGFRSISVTMRSPGQDSELAVGFLYTEGVLANKSDVEGTDQVEENVVRVKINPQTQLNLKNLERNFYTTSSCGVCGKTAIDSIFSVSSFEVAQDSIQVKKHNLYSLQQKARSRQSAFEKTGGIHAAALFDRRADFLDIREDVGRHNALDKLIGRFLLSDNLPLSECILFLSGRASFELIQKAMMAGIPVVVAVGAPSSLAIDLARSAGITLAGFLRESSFNVYSRGDRIIES